MCRTRTKLLENIKKHTELKHTTEPQEGLLDRSLYSVLKPGDRNDSSLVCLMRTVFLTEHHSADAVIRLESEGSDEGGGFESV